MEVQQQKIIPKYKQPDINKLLDAILSNRIYQSVTGETFPKGTTDDRASYIVPIISTSILGSYGKHVPFLLAAYSMSVKPFDNILHGDSTRVFSALENLATMSKRMELNSDVPRVSEDPMRASSMSRVV